MASSAYYYITGSAGNQKTLTLSGWFKVFDFTDVTFFSYHDQVSGSSARSEIYLNASSKLLVGINPSGSSWKELIYPNVMRDPAAWYNLVVAYDTTESVEADRVKVYINGNQITASSGTYPSLNEDTGWNASGYQHTIGRYEVSDNMYLNGCVTHVNFIDGTAYAPTAFGEFDSTSGIWIANSSPSVTYGDEGAFFKFASGALTTDSSGNSNTLTAVGTPTPTKDSPDNYFATWNPLAQPNGTLSNGNTSNSGCEDIGATLGAIKGKWYWEYKRTNTTNSLHYGICSTKNGFNCAPQQMLNTGTNAVGSCIYISENNTGNTTYGSAGGGFSSPSYSVPSFSIANGDVVGCALDISTSSGTVEWFKNGTSLGTASFTYDQVTEVYPFIRMNSGATTDTNFGNGYFGTTAISSAGTSSSGDDSVWEYNCPADHYGLNTKNIATYG